MIRILTGFFQIVKREAAYILKDRNIITIVLLSPLFYAFFYCSIYMYKAEKDVDVVVVDMDHSKSTQEFIKDINAHSMIKVVKVTGNFEEAKQDIYSSAANAIVYFDVDFEKSLKKGKGADVKIYLNTTRFLVSNDINKAINDIALEKGVESRIKFFESGGYSFKQARQASDPLGVDLRSLFNTTDSYGDFMISGIIILILQQTLLIGLGESVAKEREFHTVKDLYHTANGSTWALLFGKGFLYFVLYCGYAFFFFTFIFNMYSQRMDGSIPALVLTTALLLIDDMFMSIFIASFFKRKIISLQFFVLTTYPLFLFSGYSWPSMSMPAFVRGLSMLFPSTHYLNSFVRIAQMGAGFKEVLPEIQSLLIIAVIGLTLTIWRLKFLVSKEDGIEADTVFHKIGKMLKA